MTQLAMRHLRLLGPARVDQIQKAQKKAVESEAQESAAGGAPRFRSPRTVALLGYLAVERRPVACSLARMLRMCVLVVLRLINPVYSK